MDEWIKKIHLWINGDFINIHILAAECTNLCTLIQGQQILQLIRDLKREDKVSHVDTSLKIVGWMNRTYS